MGMLRRRERRRGGLRLATCAFLAALTLTFVGLAHRNHHFLQEAGGARLHRADSDPAADAHPTLQGGRGGEVRRSPDDADLKLTRRLPDPALQGAACSPDDPGYQEGQVAAVLVLCYNRPRYLERTLGTLKKRLLARSLKQKFPVYVSQDRRAQNLTGPALATREVIRRFESTDGGKAEGGFIAARLERDPQFVSLPPPKTPGHLHNYFHLSGHYKWALTQMFDCRRFPKVIILEDDMLISADFFSYFEGTHRLLDEDPTVYTISSWNDNGFAEYAGNPAEVFRTDFFPGLGWMMGANLWRELKFKWPRAFWDDWMREPAQTKGRSSVVPEVSRNANFGQERGASGNEDPMRAHVSRVVKNEVFVNFSERNLTEELALGAYRKRLQERIRRSTLLANLELAVPLSGVTRDCRIAYASKWELEDMLRFLSLAPLSHGMARGSFDGVIQLRAGRNRLLFIVPGHNQTQQEEVTKV